MKILSETEKTHKQNETFLNERKNCTKILMQNFTFQQKL